MTNVGYLKGYTLNASVEGTAPHLQWKSLWEVPNGSFGDHLSATQHPNHFLVTCSTFPGKPSSKEVRRPSLGYYSSQYHQLTVQVPKGKETHPGTFSFDAE